MHTCFRCRPFWQRIEQWRAMLYLYRMSARIPKSVCSMRSAKGSTGLELMTTKPTSMLGLPTFECGKVQHREIVPLRHRSSVEQCRVFLLFTTFGNARQDTSSSGRKERLTIRRCFRPRRLLCLSRWGSIVRTHAGSGKRLSKLIRV